MIIDKFPDKECKYLGYDEIVIDAEKSHYETNNVTIVISSDKVSEILRKLLNNNDFKLIFVEYDKSNDDFSIINLIDFDISIEKYKKNLKLCYYTDTLYIDENAPARIMKEIDCGKLITFSL